MINSQSVTELLAAFSTVFIIMAIGFGVERWRSLGQETLGQLAGLVVNVLLPIYLFYATATSTSPAELAVAPSLILLGVALPLLSLLLALALAPLARVQPEEQSAFRFSAMVGNTAFLGIPVCAGLFGTVGALYAVLLDFGTTLIILTVGIWVLSGSRSANLGKLLRNPLILGVVAGLLWALTGWEFPEWFAQPCATLGSATLPLALLVSGIQLGSIRSSLGGQWRQVTGVVAIRLLLAPLIMAAGLYLTGAGGVFAGVVLVEYAMPVGLLVAVMARSYGADADLSAATILWSTLALIVVLPALVLLFL